jgi:hypothetical protein
MGDDIQISVFEKNSIYDNSLYKHLNFFSKITVR